MRKKTQTYTVEEKLEILDYYWKKGLSETEKKFNINSGVFTKLERKYREYGVDGLSTNGRDRHKSSLGKKSDVNKDKDLLAENQRLRMEIEYLKKLDALVQEREERERKKK